MARKKVKLAFIVNNSARKTVYKKRKECLLKKVEELSTLCGVDACAIVYNPYNHQPEVWPSPWEVESVISKFRMMPELEISKKKFDQETFLKQCIIKAEKQLKTQKRENNEKAMTKFMFQCLAAGKIVDDNISVFDLNKLSWVIDNNLKDIDRRIETLDTSNFQVIAPSQVHVAAPPIPSLPQSMANNEERALMDHAHGLNLNANTMQRQWPMDLMNNGNGEEEIPFGYVNLPMGDYFPNQLP